MEQSTLVVQMKDSVWDSVWTPEFEMKHLKKAEGHIGRDVEYNNKDKINSPNILSNDDCQAFS